MWCPKCKIEYREGITVCADCGTTLEHGTEADFDVVNICSLKEESMADKFIEYLEYSKVAGAKKNYDEETASYTVTVPTDMEKKAERLFEGFMMAIAEEKALKKEEELAAKDEAAVETEEEDSEADEVEDSSEEEVQEYDWDAEEEENKSAEQLFSDEIESIGSDVDEDGTPKVLLYTPAKEYVKKEDEYKDLKFSGITFIIFGVLGLLYLVLCKTGIIPIDYNMLIFVAITAMFTVFLVLGITSLVKSSKVKEQIPAEEETTRNIKAWLKDSITAEIIEGWKDSEASEAENDLLIMAHIRAALIKKYSDADVAYLEMLSEEYYSENILEEAVEDMEEEEAENEELEKTEE